MSDMPERHQQIRQVHAALIVRVVEAINNPNLLPQLEQVFKISEENGWQNLVAALRKVVKGERDSSILKGLDEEDAVITESILRGLQDPSTLPNPEQEADPGMAAPMLAQLIHESAHGNAQALAMLGTMAEQMSTTQGDLARFSTLIKPLVDGERNVDFLCEKMGPQGESLVVSVLNELGKLEAH